MKKKHLKKENAELKEILKALMLRELEMRVYDSPRKNKRTPRRK